MSRPRARRHRIKRSRKMVPIESKLMHKRTGLTDRRMTVTLSIGCFRRVASAIRKIKRGE